MTEYLVGTPDNPVPQGAVVTWLWAEDGTRLRAAHFPATGRPRKGTVCLFTGRAEFIEKYFETIEDLRRRGYTVATMDWRGQGRSERSLRNSRYGHILDFDDFQQDIDIFMKELVLPECPPPFSALAHSMGGAVLLECARRRPNRFDRLVLTAPMLALPGLAGRPYVGRLVTLLAALGLGRLIIPGGGGPRHPAPFEGNRLTSDLRRFRRTRGIVTAAPDLGIGPPTFAWLRAAYRAMAMLEDLDRLAGIRTPTMLLAAGADRVVDNRAIFLLARRMRTARAITLDGARHEILMERDGIRDAFFAAFEAFVPGSDPFAPAPQLAAAV